LRGTRDLNNVGWRVGRLCNRNLMNDAHVTDATYAACRQNDAYKDHDDHDGAQVVERHRAVT